MIPPPIQKYLENHDIPFTRLPHGRTYRAQDLAHALHVTGHRVAKAVVVDVDGQLVMAVLPASEVVDLDRLARGLGARQARLVDEEVLPKLFPGCEMGAEPPFGRLYGLPVVVDRSLARQPRLVFRAGSHEEAVEIAWRDFQALEQPAVLSFGVAPNAAVGAEAPAE